MPDWKQPFYLPVAEKLAGKTEKLKAEMEGKPRKQTIHVYTPASYATYKKAKYPVAYVFGAGARQPGQVDKIADTLFQKQIENGKRVAPECIIVFVSTNPMGPPNVGTLKDVVVPFVDKNFRTITDRDSRLCVGFGFDAAAALMVASAANDTFGAVYAASPLMFDAARNGVVGGIRKLKKPLRVHIEWGKYDMFNPHENWDMRTMSKSFVDEIKSFKNVSISGGEVNDSTDWSSWQNRIHIPLKMLNRK